MKEISNIEYNYGEVWNISSEQKETAKSIISVIENSGKTVEESCDVLRACIAALIISSYKNKITSDSVLKVFEGLKR